MKTISLVLLFVAAAAADSYATFRLESNPHTVYAKDQIPIIRFAQDINANSDKLSFETGNGITVNQNVEVVRGRGGSYDDGYGKIVNTDHTIVKTGSYSYTSPEGTPITVNWVADENGFRAEGNHIPTTPAPLPLPVRAAY